MTVFLKNLVSLVVDCSDPAPIDSYFNAYSTHTSFSTIPVELDLAQIGPSGVAIVYFAPRNSWWGLTLTQMLVQFLSQSDPRNVIPLVIVSDGIWEHIDALVDEFFELT